MNRVLRFISYNFRRYQAHRTRGEYTEAVERLQRIQRLIAMARFIQTTRNGYINMVDDHEITLIERHIEAMFDYDSAVRYASLLDAL